MAAASKTRAERENPGAKKADEDFILLASSSDEESEENENETEEEDNEEPIEPAAGRKRKAPEADSSAVEEIEDAGGYNRSRNTNGGSKGEGEARENGSHHKGSGKEYTACYNGDPLPPWLKGIGRLGHGKLPDISDIINEEVVRFVEYISPTPEEHQMRTWVIERLQRVLDSMKMIDIAPKAKCFGSFNTRLYLPTSDIDMTVMLYDKGTTNVSARYQTKEGIRRYLYTLAKELKNAGFCTRCEVIAHARVPIIKTKENITGIAVDISINADSGLGSAAVQRSFSEHVYPYSLRAIVLVIKQFLSQRSMNEVYTGGMGSYAITLLAVSFLQMHPRVRSGGLDIAKNLGVFLIEFFELYGKRFNYDQICISVRENGRYLDKRQKGMHNMGQPYLLSIEDPCDITNDVTKGTFGINRIKQTFGGAYDLINNAVFAYHQTMKFGEPINATLKALARSNNDGSGSSSKRVKGRDGKAKKTSRSGSFNDDPWAPVSFLSSILSISQQVMRDRAKLVDAFYKGRMQKVLGVEYQPNLTALLANDASATTNNDSAPTKLADTNGQQLGTMTFDFTKSATTEPSKNDAVYISDKDYSDSDSDGQCEIYVEESEDDYAEYSDTSL